MTDMYSPAISPGPGSHAAVRTRSHPRRTSPEQSRSLPSHKRQKLNHVAHNDTAQMQDLPAAQLQQSTSQGTSSDQSASQWFDKVNQNVSHNQSQQKANNDADEPPFYLSNQISYFPNNFVSSGSDDAFGLHPRDDSENDDLRGVIDDLTVENKRLKRLLRSQRTKPSHGSESRDKLFEVRMHGLPSEKKRELEFILKDFAINLHTKAPATSTSSAAAGSGVSSASGIVKAGTRGLHTDSGYGSNSNSNSNSGMNSATRSNGGRTILPITKKNRDKSIKNYLHDIPDTLLPRQSPVMSERAKMALVVRRLEQLFTGKNAAPGEHSQPLQQQEVSQSAARADRTEDVKLNRKRKLEGSREAHIIPHDSKINLDVIDAQDTTPSQKTPSTKATSEAAEAAKSGVVTTSGSGSPDQRPTRPLDLDIHRAQIAAENIEYIRHLGLSSPHLDRGTKSPEDSWIYLNLLISMAQLHTINVTPAFIRKAIEKLSTKFELSKDGHKVRWQGGPEGTLFSRDEERAMENHQESSLESNDDTGPDSSRHSKTASSSNAITLTTPSEDKASRLQTSTASKQQPSISPTILTTAKSRFLNAFDYKPIVFKGKQYSPEESYLDSSSSYDSQSGDSSGLVHALSKSNLGSKPSSDEGTLTFFNNPFFVSDLGGDKSPVNLKPSKHAEQATTLGAPKEEDFGESPLRHHDACYFTPQFAQKPYRPSAHEEKLEFVPTALVCAGEDETQPMEMPVSGLGGVIPEDNFAVDVKIARTRRAKLQPTQADKEVAVTGRRISPRFGYKLQECERLDLQPSRLPPPSYIFFTSSSSDNVGGTRDSSDSSETSSETSSEADEGYLEPPHFLQRRSRGSSYDDSTDSSDVADSESVDLLEAARAADPARVAAQEREYLLYQPGGAGAVAGSLAATVGASRSTTSVEEESDNEDDYELRSDVDEICSDMEVE